MKQTNYQIREAGKEDAVLLASIIRESFKDVADMFGLTREDCPSHPAYCQPSWMDEGFAKGIRFFVVEEAARPLGCVGMSRPANGECELLRLAVLPQERHKGLGRLLVEHVIEQARSLRLRRVNLALIAGHVQLRQWYEQLGFVLKTVEKPPHLPFEVASMAMEIETS